MPGSLSLAGQQGCMNLVTGNSLPVVGAVAPTWKPGLWWIDTGDANKVKRWNGTTWTEDTGARYLMLLSAEPSNDTPLNLLQEITTDGYARQAVSFTDADANEPSEVANDEIITFGPFTVDMEDTAEYAALVDVASGTSGQVLYSWELQEPQQVHASQTIQVAVGFLTAAIG